MPYKDPERKRQWEREHREERNARRRKSQTSSVVDAPSSSGAMYKTMTEQPDIRINITPALVVVLASVVIPLLAAWYLRRAGEADLPKP